MISKKQCADGRDVELTSGVLKERQETGIGRTIASTMKKCVETGRLRSLETPWQEGMPDKPHVYWDSDLAKVMEGMAASLALRPDAALEKEYDRWVDLFVASQQPDGYLNTHFTTVEPEKRFTNLLEAHELYCCGHLIEAAVAGYTLLGKRKLLDAMCRYADYLCTVFGPHGVRQGWPGHEEIELALVKLYRVTHKKRYLELAAYFVNDRGTQPNFFVGEYPKPLSDEALKHFQALKPVREENEAVGHAVRAVYFYCGVADVANLTDDGELLASCRKIFDNLTQKRMYVTGGIGSSFHGEAITSDYDLQNGSLMYAESCAAMGFTFFCRRMLDITCEEKYASFMERALFNGVMSGISLDGEHYFYTNYLEVDENLHCYNAGSPVRKEWFDCSCCPTSFARYLTQLAQFVAAFDDERDHVYLHIPTACKLHHAFADGKTAEFEVSGSYPYDGNIKIDVRSAGEWTLDLRLPGWCDDVAVSVNGKEVYRGAGGNYLPLHRVWRQGDRVEMKLALRIQFLHADSRVTNDLGRIAIQRGPVVYCIESPDAPCPVREIVLDPECADMKEVILDAGSGLPAGTVALQFDAWRETVKNDGDALYFEGETQITPIRCTAIPYALWQNRGPSQMAVWIRTMTERKER